MLLFTSVLLPRSSEVSGQAISPILSPTTHFLITQNASVQKGILSKSRRYSLKTSQLAALHIVFASEMPKLLSPVKFFYFFKSYCVVFLEDTSWQIILIFQPIALYAIRSFSCYPWPIFQFELPLSLSR